MSLTSDYASQIDYKIISASDSQNEKEANDDFSPANPSDSLKESSLLEVFNEDSLSVKSDMRPHPSGKCVIACSRKNERNMIRCTSCMLWVHCTCVGEKADYQGAWTCHQCRLSSTRISLMMNEMTKMKSEFSVKLLSCEQKCSELSQELNSLRQTNTDLIDQIRELHKENQTLKINTQDKIQPRTTQTLPSLVIGDSLIRDISPKNSDKLEIKSISGATMDTVTSTLLSLENNNKKYDHLYLVVGSNDCSAEQTTVKSMENSAKGLFVQAQKIASNVLFSSILPRTDNSSANLKGENANVILKTLCHQSNVKHVDNNGIFLTADRSPNDALLLDGLHPNDKGTKKLISNLGVEAVPRPRNQQPKMNTYRVPPSSIPTWNNAQTTRQQRAPIPPLIPPSSHLNFPWNQNYNQQPYLPYQNQPWNQPQHQTYGPMLQPNSSWNSARYSYGKNVNNNIVCFKCNLPGHKSSQCSL